MASDSRADLARFVLAQGDTIEQARAELAQGRKHSHWMWFVFPQLAGLGSSATAQRYAISGLPEARRYLAHPLLGPRLADCVTLMMGWAGQRSAVAILGAIDALKFCSSMTLFEQAAADADGAAERFGKALDVFCAGRRDDRTLHLLAAAQPGPASESGTF